LLLKLAVHDVRCYTHAGSLFETNRTSMVGSDRYVGANETRAEVYRGTNDGGEPMRVEIGTDRTADPVRGVLLLSGWFVVCALVTGLSRLTFVWPSCHFREWTGIPCLTCGSTRMVDALLSGDLLAAMAWNPLVFLTLAAVTVWVVLAAVGIGLGRPSRRLILAPRERLGMGLLCAGLLALDWSYLIWRGV
jgi:hypothetical protein